MITFKFVDGYISPVLSTGDIIEVGKLLSINWCSGISEDIEE